MVRRLIAAALLATGLAACGSSSTASTASTASTNGTQGTTPFSAIATANAHAHPGDPARTATDRRHTAPRPPEVPRNRMPQQRGHGAAAGITAGFTISATMAIHSGDRLSPPVIALPTFKRVTLKLTVRDDDHHAHTIVVGTRRFHVPAGGHVLLTIHHLADGTHAVAVDGQTGGKITVGSAGGP
jgi:hypothetical protein